MHCLAIAERHRSHIEQAALAACATAEQLRVSLRRAETLAAETLGRAEQAEAEARVEHTARTGAQVSTCMHAVENR
jgi:hypothetical protein